MDSSLRAQAPGVGYLFRWWWWEYNQINKIARIIPRQISVPREWWLVASDLLQTTQEIDNQIIPALYRCFELKVCQMLFWWMKKVSFHQYLKHLKNCVSNMRSAMECAGFQQSWLSVDSCKLDTLFEHDIHSRASTYCLHSRPMPKWVACSSETSLAINMLEK